VSAHPTGSADTPRATRPPNDPAAGGGPTTVAATRHGTIAESGALKLEISSSVKQHPQFGQRDYAPPARAGSAARTMCSATGWLPPSANTGFVGTHKARSVARIAKQAARDQAGRGVASRLKRPNTRNNPMSQI